jgi:hypothetical protein
LGWQPGDGGGTGDEPGSGLPGRGAQGGPSPAGAVAGRDPGLAGFARDGQWDACRPSATLAVALESAAGPEWRCSGATQDELLGLLRQAQAIETWAASAKLGVLRALIRDDDQPLQGGGYHGDLPDGWSRSLTHEVALALSVPAVSAEKQLWVAWDLAARLPGTGELLAGGSLTYAKAKAVYEAFQLLSDPRAAQAEALILDQLPGKTYSQVQKLAVQAAISVDPEAASERRKDAEQNKCRVQLFREESGAAALSGRDLPTDQTLAAHASVCARAQEYKDSGAFPRDTGMDQFRVAGYLDLLNGIPAAARIASGDVGSVRRPGPAPETGDAPEAPEPREASEPHETAERPGSIFEPPGRTAGTAPRLADLVLPLATLLGLAERPGQEHGLGPLDPDLCRELAAAVIASPWSRLCVTVTGPDGTAIGHGCARRRRKPGSGPVGTRPFLGLPARANLTVTATQLAELAAAAGGAWSFTRTGDPGPPGGHGSWTLTLPDGRSFTVELGPVPTLDCDHRHETHAYQPGDTLRHLVQVRDGECTFPSCSRHARESDFEHAVPFDQGGRTCACNAGARSRQCHQVKQSKGWHVSQPRPGWHRWETPSGRSYTQGPKQYPV